MGLDGFIIPISDEHMSEYVGAYAQRLAWLTGFNGSAGSAAVLATPGPSGRAAAIAVDGRYEIQVRDQVPGDIYDYVDVPAGSLSGWLTSAAARGAKIGYDGWLHGETWLAATTRALAAHGITLVPVA
ncbi:MAG: aminopeptidase P family N-terminal domain-containing protein, partial [Sphingopyxis sp.]|nr:aminopeptidase P family N-terminal domain-containing protein [Sphingopyxis sp.]